MLSEQQRTTWYPIASSNDLPPRHVFHAVLWGQHLAVWRADDGHVNVWEDRCLHRGVRLTLGFNLGSELMCQYHGWRYANRSAACTYIPAHPADAPARTICNRTCPAIERSGLIWSTLGGNREIGDQIPDVAADVLVLRPLPVDAPPKEVETELELCFAAEPIRFFVQPTNTDCCVIRGVLNELPTDPVAALRNWNSRLTRLRERIETRPRAPDPPIAQEFKPVAEEFAGLPEPGKRSTELTVRVERKWPVAEDVMAFRLGPVEGGLSSFQPGAHIDVQLPNGLTRQYSITNGPDDTSAYVIGVKREGGGGSVCLHDTVREGDLLAISAPRNNFPLRRDGLLTRFIAGGIGLTPLLSMARTLQLSRLEFEFHQFARSDAHLPFAERLSQLGDAVRRHVGLDAQATGARLGEIIGPQGEKHELYVCGPTPFMDAARTIAADLEWPEEAVHFEYFKNETPRDTSSGFEVALARSALTVEIAPGQSIVDGLRAHGIHIPVSCEQGACGTCRVTVIEGEIDHQDVQLTQGERARGDCMMACVSRAISKRIVLDL